MSEHCPGCSGEARDDKGYVWPCSGCGHEEQITALTAQVEGLKHSLDVREDICRDAEAECKYLHIQIKEATTILSSDTHDLDLTSVEDIGKSPLILHATDARRYGKYLLSRLTAADSQVEALTQERDKEKQCADENFTSYERMKADRDAVLGILVEVDSTLDRVLIKAEIPIEPGHNAAWRVGLLASLLERYRVQLERAARDESALTAELRTAGEALGTVWKMTGHHHWDSTMQHGAGCELCITQRSIMETILAALSLPHLKRLLEGA